MKMIFTACFFCLLASPLLGQNADPFGGGNGVDPFGGGNGADPFGGGNGADPFGQKQTDPIAQKNTDNPFNKKFSPFSRNGNAPKADAKAAPGAAGKAVGQPKDLEARIRSALSDETTQTFVDTPLEQAAMAISKTHDIPIVINRAALEEIGLTPDTPVRIDLQRVSLRSFLRLMLREFDMTYIVKDEVLQLTTIECAEQNLIVKMHVFPSSLTGKSEQIIKALQGTVSPGSWDAVGGPASAHVVENVIAVSATEHLHDEVDAFLVKLEEAYMMHLKKAK